MDVALKVNDVEVRAVIYELGNTENDEERKGTDGGETRGREGGESGETSGRCATGLEPTQGKPKCFLE